MSGDGQTLRFLVVGMSGSGKSHLTRDLIAHLEGRYRYLVVVNDSMELSEGCAAKVPIRDENVGDAWRLVDLIRDAGSAHFEILANDPRPFLERLGDAVLELGDVLLVLDEAHEWIPSNRPPAALVRCYKQGRKHGVHIIAVTQSLVRTSTTGLDANAIRQSTHLITFQLAEHNEVARIREVMPELGDRVADLAPPGDGRPPEYAVRDVRRSMSLIHGRGGVEWLSTRTVGGEE